MLPEGERLCREILLEEYRMNPKMFFKVMDGLGVSRKDVTDVLIEASAEEALRKETRCYSR